jgi:hypothetical protein
MIELTKIGQAVTEYRGTCRAIQPHAKLCVTSAAQWPFSSLWVIGLFVGIEMLLYGWSLVMLAIAAKNMPSVATTTA